MRQKHLTGMGKNISRYCPFKHVPHITLVVLSYNYAGIWTNVTTGVLLCCLQFRKKIRWASVCSGCSKLDIKGTIVQ
jgi:hypothetical protein